MNLNIWGDFQICISVPLSLRYNEANRYFFLDGTEIYKFKAKDSEIVVAPLSLGKISKEWSVDNTKKTEFNGYVCDAADVDDMVDIHNYLMKKNAIV